MRTSHSDFNICKFWCDLFTRQSRDTGLFLDIVLDSVRDGGGAMRLVIFGWRLFRFRSFAPKIFE